MQPGGRLVAEGMPLRFLINRAFNTNNNDQVVGLPAFVGTDRYDINAKTPGGTPSMGPMDMDAVAVATSRVMISRARVVRASSQQRLHYATPSS